MSAENKKRFDDKGDEVAHKIAEDQKKREADQQFAAAVFGTIIIIILGIGMVLGDIILIFFFIVIEKPLNAFAFFIKQNRLRRIIGVLGLLIYITAYLIRMSQ